MRKLFILILITFNFCAPRIKLKPPLHVKYEEFPKKKFSLDVKIKNKKAIFPSNFEKPPEREIRDYFVNLLESRGLVHIDSFYDYKIYMEIDSLCLFPQIPKNIRTIGNIFAIMETAGTIMLVIGLAQIYRLAWTGEGNESIAMTLFWVGSALTIPWWIFIDIMLYLKFNFKGIFSVNVKVLNEKEDKIFEKNYFIVLKKRWAFGNIQNPYRVSEYFSEILEKFFLDFEKDAQNIFR